jgi:hypothetical protein
MGRQYLGDAIQIEMKSPKRLEYTLCYAICPLP